MKRVLSVLTLTMMLCTMAPALCSASPSGPSEDPAAGLYLRCRKCGQTILAREQKKYMDERCVLGKLGKSTKSATQDGKHDLVPQH